ncbi:urea carboxylase-associated family protein [Pendulispora rubella]|uniref:Urea carboxylase-associated family protein n=1 Tax=Pendulispora rubella TaxID=2741070 RepID=A0ABZ2L352_9BACT
MPLETIPAGHGTHIPLERGKILRVIDPEGGQSGDLVAFRAGDVTEWLSNGRSFDYGAKIYFSTGDVLYSNKSQPMLTIVRDDVGRHDFLFTSCSIEMFRIQYGIEGYHSNCIDNICNALQHLRVKPHMVPTAFNFFMNAKVAPDGRITIEAPCSRAADAIYFRAEMDLAIALTACPAPSCNGGPPRPVAYEILDHLPPS